MDNLKGKYTLAQEYESDSTQPLMFALVKTWDNAPNTKQKGNGNYTFLIVTSNYANPRQFCNFLL
jgi:hypothetical protein